MTMRDDMAEDICSREYARRYGHPDALSWRFLISFAIGTGLLAFMIWGIFWRLM